MEHPQRQESWTGECALGNEADGGRYVSPRGNKTDVWNPHAEIEWVQGRHHQCHIEILGGSGIVLEEQRVVQGGGDVEMWARHHYCRVGDGGGSFLRREMLHPTLRPRYVGLGMIGMGKLPNGLHSYTTGRFKHQLGIVSQ